MKLDLDSAAWNELVTFLIDRDVIRDEDDARTGYTGRGEQTHCIGFTLPLGGPSQLRLGAALADAFREIETLLELTADGFGVDDLLNHAASDSLGRDVIIYFPGHKAQQS